MNNQLLDCGCSPMPPGNPYHLCNTHVRQDEGDLEGGTSIIAGGGAANHRGSSEQSVGTPRDLLDAVETRFGRITFDLAADANNCVVAPDVPHPTVYFTQQKTYFDKADDSLAQDWPLRGVNWLNPEFADVAPWVAKCRRWVSSGRAEAGALVILLVPASVDSNWWMENVAGHARVLSLNPRVKFVGHKQGFPKPLALCAYDARFPMQPNLVEPWRWKK